MQARALGRSDTPPRKEEMATKMDKKLFKQVRSLGVRKSRAREVAEAVRKSPEVGA